MVEDVSTDIAAPLRRRLLRGVGDTTWDLFSRRTWMCYYRVVTVEAAITVQLVQFNQSDHRWGGRKARWSCGMAACRRSFRCASRSRRGLLR